MMFKVLFVLGVAAVVADQGEYDLDEKDEECIKKTNLGKDMIKTYSNGKLVPEDVYEMEQFMGCRYGHNFDDHNKFINNDESIDEVVYYLAAFLHSNKKLALTLSKQIMLDCAHIEANSRAKTIVKVYNCVMRELEEYNVPKCD